MAQATGAISFKDCKIEISSDNSEWVDISGFSSSVLLDGGERITATKPTFDGDTLILRSGKRATLTLTAAVIYTEGASDATEVLRAAYEAGSNYYMRYSPKGGDSAEFLYTSDVGVIKQPLYPGGDSEGADIVMVALVLETPKVTKSAVA